MFADLSQFQVLAVSTAVLICLLVLHYSTTGKHDYPTINEPKSWFFGADKQSYIKDAQSLLAAGARKFGGRPYYLNTDSGHVIMLPPDQIDAINMESRLSFNKYIGEENLSKFTTFQTMRPPPPGMFEEAVLKGITRALPKYTKPISIEMSQCLEEVWPQSSEWKEIALMPGILKCVARLSNRIFLGESFTQNEDWLRITTEFTIDLFTAIAVTRFFSPILRPFVDLVSPLNRKVRKSYKDAAAILAPVLKQRHEAYAKAQEAGERAALPDDSIEWFRNAAHGRPYNETCLQLGLAVAAIHTTSDLLAQAILNLGAHAETLEPLRKEAVSVLQTHGLQKTALYELHLLDSFLKETQRLKPIAMASMHRSAVADVELPGGIKIRKGEHTAISSQRMWDEEEYAEPKRFNAWRYVERRKLPGHEHRSLLVSTSPEHLGFAHGKHACPGRFFAANEVKIAMLHIILKYDVKLVDTSHAQWQTYGVGMMVNSKAKVLYRTRRPEIDIDELAAAL